ncbi:MAG: Multidrug resistance protein MdtC [Phycisphaerae bacterium]|nr:Multidrug resistance protein MdtC [Phycisphaerae bacterium]
MIGKLIQWCINNRAMVLLLTLFVIAGGIWATFTIKLDAIPDLSDVQVVIRTEFPGQAPQIVEDQVTYPLTTAMLAVPYAKVVRGYSMFGSSFVYIIFEDGTDLYWARSRVLEQLSFVAGKLPSNVSPQLGPDATGVGWVYEYVLTTGKYCPDHHNGAWHDPDHDQWYADAAEAPEAVRPRLVHHRVFQDSRYIYADLKENRRYDTPEKAPAEARGRLERIELVKGRDTCPLDGRNLVRSDQDLADLRGHQDWYLRYELTAVDGVSEVASLGGFVKQYQVVVDPVKLLAYKIPVQQVRMALQRSNSDVGGRLIEISETEYMVRGLGYLGTLSDAEIADARAAGKSVDRIRTERVLTDLRKIALGATEDGTPIYLADLAEVRTGPEIRRGVADWNGEGETVGGIIVMRFGQNARTTIDRVRQKLADLEKGLPPGVAIEVGYDRSDLIDRAVHTLSGTLMEEITVVALVCILFLLHARSELVAVFVVPTGVLASILLMRLLGINANIMSLGGIAIAIGVMVDSSIVMVENSHKHLDREEDRLHRLAAAGLAGVPEDRRSIIARAATEVGPSLFFSLLIITVSFLPVFALGEQSGRLFRPLAFTKTFAMGSSAFLAVTIIPVLMSLFITARVLPKRWGWKTNLAVTMLTMLIPAAIILLLPLSALAPYRHWLAIGWIVLAGMLLVPQKIIHERANPISWALQRLYHPFFVAVMSRKWLTLAVAFTLLLITLWPLSRLGSEFMPPLEEGDLLYMPTTDPGISMDKARELLQQTDNLIKQFPEVESVLGKAGRAETATDPAPPSMLETTITLRRDKSRWRQKPLTRFYSGWPAWARWLPARIWSDTRAITVNELIYGYEWPDGRHVPGLNEVVQIPGLTNAWTMPIKTRIDMLSTGIKTPVGIKVMGPDLKTLSELASQIAQVVKTSDGTGPYTVSAFPEKSVGGNYLDIRPRDDLSDEQLQRYGLKRADVQDVIMSALGGMNATSTVEGLQRYPVNIRYPHELRDNIDSLKQTLVATPNGAQVPLAQLATFNIHKGPPMVKSENARLTSWVYVDIAGIDVGTYVANAQRAVDAGVKLPPGYSVVWSGQYEYMEAARKRLMVVVPIAAVLIILLLYMATHSWLRVGIVLLAVPFSLVGAVWLLYFLDYNLSLAVWVGIIALAGLDAETGLVMLLYLDNSFERFRAEGRMRNPDDLWHAVHDGAVMRIRPKTMTVVTTFIGLVPLMWASGAGADTMRRLAAPMIGGLAISFIMELLVYPVIFYLAKRVALTGRFHHAATAQVSPTVA